MKEPLVYWLNKKGGIAKRLTIANTNPFVIFIPKRTTCAGIAEAIHVNLTIFSQEKKN